MLKKFVELLLPSLEKRQLLSQIDETLESIQREALPTYHALVKNQLFTRQYAMRSDWGKKRQQLLQAETKLNLGVSEIIERVLVAANKRLEWVRKEIDASFEEKTFKDGITYPKAALLQLFEACAFTARYSREFLIALYGYEIPSYFKNADGTTIATYSDYDLKRIEKEFATFAFVAATLVGNLPVEKMISDIPDLVVDLKDKSGVAATIGNHRVAPLSLGFITPEYNPFFRVGRWYAERQVKSLNKKKKELDALNLYMIQLKNSRDGRNNAAVEKQLNELSSDIQKLAYQIQQEEQEYLEAGGR